MKRKTAIKKLMSMGVDRNLAKTFLDYMHICCNVNNADAVNLYKTYGVQLFYTFESLA